MKVIFSVHIAREEHSWSKSPSFLRCVAQGSAKLDLVPQIARSCNSCRQISWTELDLVKMGMHIPETRQQEFAADIDGLRSIRDFDLRSRTGGNYPVASNHNR